MTLFVIVYHIGLILLAYRVGRDNAGPGVAVFLVGVVGFQLFVNGPSSFIDGGCDRYSHIAQDC